MTRPVPRWLRVVRDYPRACSIDGAWCRTDGEAHPDWRWLSRSRAHLERHWSLRRRGVHDTRWTVTR